MQQQENISEIAECNNQTENIKHEAETSQSQTQQQNVTKISEEKVKELCISSPMQIEQSNQKNQQTSDIQSITQICPSDCQCQNCSQRVEQLRTYYDIYMWGSAEMDQFEMPEEKMETRSGFKIDFFNVNKVQIVDIVCGALHTMALTVNGLVYSWGCNDDRVLGRDGFEKQPGLVQLEAPVNLISAGDTHSMAANQYHSLVYLWGNYRTTAGKMTKEPMHPHRIGAHEFEKQKIVKIMSGYNHSMILTKEMNKKGQIIDMDGTGGTGVVWLWGDSESNVIGRHPTPRRKYNQSLDLGRLGIKNVVDIYTGGYHSFLKRKEIKNQQTTFQIYAWGNNNYGQLGLGHTRNEFVDVGQPVKVHFFNNIPVHDIFGGEHHSVVIAENGDVYTFGRNTDGELGLGEDYVPPEEPLLQVEQNQNTNLQEQQEKQEKVVSNKKDFVCVPTLKPDIKDAMTGVTAPSTTIVITKTHKAYSWGCGNHYLLANGTEDSEWSIWAIRDKFFKERRLLDLKLGAQHGVFMIYGEQMTELTAPKLDIESIQLFDQSHLGIMAKNQKTRSTIQSIQYLAQKPEPKKHATPNKQIDKETAQIQENLCNISLESQKQQEQEAKVEKRSRSTKKEQMAASSVKKKSVAKKRSVKRGGDMNEGEEDAEGKFDMEEIKGSLKKVKHK